jgi:hypothetical protein
LCIEQEIDSEHILGYAEMKEVTLNKEKLDFADTENVISDKKDLFMQIGKKNSMINRNWIVLRGRQ